MKTEEINKILRHLSDAEFDLTYTQAKQYIRYLAKDVRILLAEIEQLTSNNSLTRLFVLLNLSVPQDINPVCALEQDIKRLLDTEKLWIQACDIARTHCPVSVGESHIRTGIPRLAKRVKELEEKLSMIEKKDD